MALSWDQRQRLDALGLTGELRSWAENELESKPEWERDSFLETMEQALSKFKGSRGAGLLDSPYIPPPPSPQKCERCERQLKGAYYTFKKPSGGKADLCKRCRNRVTLRLRMLACKPNFKARSMAKQALRDLKEAARLDPKDEAIRKNIEGVRSLKKAARGSPLIFSLFWIPVWSLVLLFDLAITAAVGLAFVGLMLIPSMYKEDSWQFKTAAVVLALIYLVWFGSIAVAWIGRKISEINDITNRRYY
ncbi:MAG: hypothetical protein HZB13_10510 [Acidobacteria bacterium]|nr:hypothetical protein [Acidobacteriota bacterium]